MGFGLLFADILYLGPRAALAAGIRSVLQAAGYVVRSAELSAGPDELPALLQPPPDLVLLALQPDLEAGCETIRRIKSDPAFPFIPLMAMGSQGGTTETAAALDAGADDYLASEPELNHALLLLRVRTLLRLGATAGALEELNATLEQRVQERTRQLETLHRQLRHAEKLAALGRLAASLAHEISNPVTGINTYLYLLKEDWPPDSPSRQSLAIIEREVGRINTLTRQLRNFSRPPQEQRKPTALDEVLEHVLLLTDKNLREQKIAVVRDFAPQLPAVSAAPDQMEQVFLNLVLNARDAMPEGGTLTLRTRESGGWVLGEVVDTGIGIGVEQLERIFEPFYTTKESGTGLGLAICYRILCDHHGRIAVDSRPGQGTTFSVQLPLPGTEGSVCEG